MAIQNKITPCLWFDGNAEEAARFYTGIFKDSRIGKITYTPNEGQETHGREAGSVLVVEFFLEGQKFIGLNGGPTFQFTEAISLMVHVETQEELDYYWDRLREGGDPESEACGWLKDKFGLSWQITPTVLLEMITDPDQAKADRTFKAMMEMTKLDIAELERVYRGS